jgi:threonine dehydratase
MGNNFAAPDLDAVQKAREILAALLPSTPVLPYGGSHLKLECLQPTGSFKVRGFVTAALSAVDAAREQGVLTVSAGNAALAAAHACAMLGVPCRVVMPDTAPRVKAQGVRDRGGRVEQLPRDEFVHWVRGESWRGEPELFIHPFADAHVMSGSGTVALELLEQVPDLTRVVVPVGGGGLIAGIATVMRALRPGAEIVGVQSDGYPLWPATFASGEPAHPVPDTIADGTTAPYHAGMELLLRRLVDRWIVVPETTLRAAVKRLAVQAKLVAEGAGALAPAALGLLPRERGTVAIVSGGNIDPALLTTLLAES